MENSRRVKQILFAIGYIVIFGFFAWYLYYIIAPDPTCSDKKQNQNEKGIDCGGPCKPCQAEQETVDLQISEKAFVDGGNGTTDVVFKLNNPNSITGAPSFSYAIALKDANGNVVAERQGTSFILPVDTRYVAELGLRPAGDVVVTDVDVKITSTDWKEIENFGKPQMNAYRKSFQHAPTGAGNIVEGVVRNESTFDLKTVNLVIVLRDESGKIIAVNTSQKESLRSREEQSFRVTWPYDLKGEVERIDVDMQSNVYN